MELLFFFGGVIFGTIVTLVLMHRKAGHGYFRLDPLPEEEGFYTVNVQINPYQNLLKKDCIILEKDTSPK